MIERRVKLIRSKLPESLPGDFRATFKRERYLHNLLLVRKIMEEIGEVEDSAFSDEEEYADVLQCLMDLARVNKVSWSTIEQARQSKEESKGNFSEGIVIITDRPSRKA